MDPNYLNLRNRNILVTATSVVVNGHVPEMDQDDGGVGNILDSINDGVVTTATTHASNGNGDVDEVPEVNTVSMVVNDSTGVSNVEMHLDATRANDGAAVNRNPNPIFNANGNDNISISGLNSCDSEEVNNSSDVTSGNTSDDSKENREANIAVADDVTVPISPYDQLRSYFDCPVCYDPAPPPINQCTRGHVVCNRCLSMLTFCPICKDPTINIRNLAMDNIAAVLKFPCKFAANGCDVEVFLNAKLDHEAECNWKNYNCLTPLDNCTWNGPAILMRRHILYIHDRLLIKHGPEVSFRASLRNSFFTIDWFALQECHDQIFLFVLQKREHFEGPRQYRAMIQLLGVRKLAAKFRCELTVNGPEDSVAWTGVPSSVEVGVESFTRNAECLGFSKTLVPKIVENGILTVNVKITKI